MSITSLDGHRHHRHHANTDHPFCLSTASLGLQLLLLRPLQFSLRDAREVGQDSLFSVPNPSKDFPLELGSTQACFPGL